jgi:hypothetical protein
VLKTGRANLCDAARTPQLLRYTGLVELGPPDQIRSSQLPSPQRRRGVGGEGKLLEEKHLSLITVHFSFSIEKLE